MKKLLFVINLLLGTSLYTQTTHVAYNDAIIGFDVSENGKYLAFFDHKFSVLIYKNNKKIDSISFKKHGLVDIKLSKKGDFVFLLSQINDSFTSKLIGSKITVYKRIKSKLIFSSEIYLNETYTHLEISDNFLLAFSSQLTKLIQLGTYSIHSVDKRNLSNIIYSDNNYLYLKSENIIYKHNVQNHETDTFFNSAIYGSPLLINKEGLIFIENKVIYNLLFDTKKLSKDSTNLKNTYDDYFTTKNYKDYTLVFCDHSFILINSVKVLNPLYFKFQFDLDAVIKKDKLFYIDNFNISVFDLIN